MLREIVQFLLGNLVVLFMVAAGLEIDLKDVWTSWQRPGGAKLAARSLLVVTVGVPLLALSVVAVIPMALNVKALILFMAACPGRLFVLKKVREAGASIPASIHVLALVGLVVPLTVPFWVAVMGHMHGVELSLDPMAVFSLSTKMVLLPLALGCAINSAAPGIAKYVAVWINRLASVALLLAMAVVMFLGVPHLGVLFPGPFVAMLAIVTGSLLLGRWAGGQRRDERKAVQMAAITGDPALVLAIVANNFPEARIQALLAACIVLRALLLVPYRQLVKRIALTLEPKAVSKGVG